MRWFALALALIAFPASPGAGIQVMLNGQFVGTLDAPLAYTPGIGTIVITTREGSLCQIDRIFWDRFEG